MISINWATRVIFVPQSYLTFISGSIYEMDIEQFRKDLKDLEDSDEGMNFPATHQRNAPTVLSGVTYAQTFEIINGYTITFEDTGAHYTVRFTGANHNIADVTNFDAVNLVIGNSAGLIQIASGSGLSPSQDALLTQISILIDELHRLQGLRAGQPMTVTPTQRTAGDIQLAITGDGENVTIVTRQP